ncbi:hypothetical protein [Agreia pratensis]|uniref:Uncharacterized protein n=1 Tax=Agreia pratensis TaxID=150121 RepID=A0A1X7JAH5_9MICO|nr:hypothetical protein [Agreia pratensis]SMG24632.1 hypothetical protein SAMN06296010_1193 [Agreia pratensis]
MPLQPLYLEWLSEPDGRVLRAKAANLRQLRITWNMSLRKALGHLNAASMLWYLTIALISIDTEIDKRHDGQVLGSDWGSLAWMLGILGVWIFASAGIAHRTRSSARAQSTVTEWRQNLTALANGFEPQPSQRATFTSMITADGDSVVENPRFTASGLEFGSLTTTRPGSTTWHYLAATLPAPLPRLVLDSTSNNASRSDLPPHFGPLQRISLEREFDRAFVTYAPVDNRADALYVLSPEVMSELVQHASDYNVEIVDDTLVLFTAAPTDFTDAQSWNAVYTLVNTVVPRLIERTQRFVDERLPRPHRSLATAFGRTAFEGTAAQPVASPVAPPVAVGVLAGAPVPLIARSGRRFVAQRRPWRLSSFLRGAGMYLAYFVGYFVPIVLIFAAIMSITDGRP